MNILTAIVLLPSVHNARATNMQVKGHSSGKKKQASQLSQFYCESHSFRLNLKVSQARQKISQ